jgi:hypothetical protein
VNGTSSCQIFGSLLGKEGLRLSSISQLPSNIALKRSQSGQ